MRAAHFCAAALLAVPGAAAAADGKWSFDASIGGGGEYDSNVAVDEADINTHRGDEALLLSGSAGVRYNNGKGARFEIGYDFDQTLHQDETDFDLQLHGLSASALLTSGKMSFGLDGRYRHALLGGHKYLDLYALAPSVSARLNDKTILRATVTAIWKEFVHSEPLDGTSVAAQADAYRYFAKRRGYVSLGLRYDRDDVAAPEFDYGGFQAIARLQFPIDPLGSRARLRVGYTYAQRDYTAVTPSIGTERHEKRSTVTAALDIPLNASLSLKPSFRYVDRNSNLASADYQEQVASTMLEYRF